MCVGVTYHKTDSLQIHMLQVEIKRILHLGKGLRIDRCRISHHDRTNHIELLLKRVGRRIFKFWKGYKSPKNTKLTSKHPAAL